MDIRRLGSHEVMVPVSVVAAASRLRLTPPTWVNPPPKYNLLPSPDSAMR